MSDRSTVPNGVDLSRRQSLLAAGGIFAAAVIPAALLPDEAKAADLGNSQDAQPDPVFAAIDAYIAARRTYNASDAADNSAEQAALWAVLMQAETAMIGTVPTSPAGAAALCAKVLDVEDLRLDVDCQRGVIRSVQAWAVSLGGSHV